MVADRPPARTNQLLTEESSLGSAGQAWRNPELSGWNGLDIALDLVPSQRARRLGLIPDTAAQPAP
jgi:hypothetical protein